MCSARNGTRSIPSGIEEIAILGMGCRFPGGVSNPESFWRLLVEGRDAIEEVPDDRWSIRRWFRPRPIQPGKSYSRWGGFVRDIDRFDARFFGISPREASEMDPQQRLMLEVAWEAFEDAGLPLDALAGKPIGVFVGASSNDYAQLQWDCHSDGGCASPYTIAGGALSLISNRVSYAFDLRGPSLTVDTACSSSLVALHLACESLRRGECDVALVGGVNALLMPAPFVGFSQAQMLSPDGRCRSFGADANGFVRAEGAGAVILKRLGDATAAADPVRAVVLATGTNQDGRTTGISLPNEDAQADLLREVLERTGIAPADVGYFEAHGTGTPAGDPIEARAIGRTLGTGRSADAPLLIGSVKTNFGHLEPASGIAGMLKTVLCLEQQAIPASLHSAELNPRIDFASLGLRVVSELTPWEAAGNQRRVAAINSFGFGGTNAHALLAEASKTPLDGSLKRDGSHNAPSRASGAESNGHHRAQANGSEDRAASRPGPETDEAPSALIPLSARTETALRSAAQSWAAWLQDESAGAPTLSEIAFTAGVRRTHHDHRLACVAGTRAELRESLEAWLRGEQRRTVTSGRVSGPDPIRVAFVFNGMGSQWAGMGQGLLGEPAFRGALEEIDEAFARLSGWSILEHLSRDEFHSRVQETEVAQPLIFAVQVGLAALWRAWGVVPHAVVGHSVGEAAAAYAAGVLSLDTAVRVIFHRSRLQHRLRGRGRMLALSMPLDLARSMAEAWQGGVEIAAINGPASVTLAGEQTALEELHRAMESSQAFCRFLPVDVPYHSGCMDEIAAELRESLAGLESGSPACRFFSTVTGGPLESPVLDADYWCRNARQPVQFLPAMQALAGTVDAVVEVGAHPVLMNAIRECSTETDAASPYVPSMRRDVSQRRTLLEGVGRLFALGAPVRWGHIASAERVVSLPRYPWERESHWAESEPNRASRLGLGTSSGNLLGKPEHPLLGQLLLTSQSQSRGEKLWRQELDVEGDAAYLGDHVVQGTAVFPAAGFVELSLAAAARRHPGQSLRIERLEIARPIVLPRGRRVSVETSFDERSGEVVINSRDGEGDWQRHATCCARADYAPWEERAPEPDVDASAASGALPVEEVYAQFRALGLEYGPAFQALVEVRAAESRATARIRLPETLHEDAGEYCFPPSVLDACLQLILCAAWSRQSADGLYLPVRIGRLRVRDAAGLARASAAGLVGSAQIRESTAKGLRADVVLRDESDRVLAEIEGIEVAAVPGARGPTFEFEDCVWIHRWDLRARPGEWARSPVASPGEIHAAVAPRVKSLSIEWERPRFYATVRPAHNAIARAFFVDALRAMGFDFRTGESFELPELAARLGVVEGQTRLLGAILRALSQCGILRAEGARWEVVGSPADISGERLCREALTRCPELQSDLLLLSRTGRNLREVLRGQNNPVELFFPGGSGALAESIYASSPYFAIYNRIVQEVVSEIVQRLPPHSRLRVLEIGGGTGATTAGILPLFVPERTDYVFTDVSPQLLASAQQRFRDFPFVRFASLDLERDPEEQDFSAGDFDLVLGVDVVHATTDVRRTLRHLRNLLAPRGTLLMTEPTRDQPAHDATFGILRGWWHFTDTGLRRNSPLLDSGAWRDVLEQTGFEDFSLLCDDEDPAVASQSVILARAPEGAVASSEPAEGPPEGLPETLSSPQTPAVWWIAGAAGPTASEISRRVEQAGGRAVLFSSGAEPPANPDYPTLLSRAARAGEFPEVIVHLGAYAAPSGHDVPAEAVRRSQREGLHDVVALAQACLAGSEGAAPRLWIVTRGAQAIGLPEETPLCVAASPVWGLARVLQNEGTRLRCSAVDLSPEPAPAEFDSLVREIAADGEETEVALRGGERYVPRLEKAPRTDADAAVPESFRAYVARPGALNSVTLRPAERRAPGPGEVEIEVAAAALNFKDVAKGLNLLSAATLSGTMSGESLGLECAGRIAAVGPGVTGFAPGDRVVALANDCFGPFTTIPAILVFPIPDALPFEAAATIPVVFLTAQYALHELARIRPGERVLIHAAAGGVGHAAIQIARAAGAEIIATAGSLLKREYLESLGLQHVFDSRSLAFVDDVRRVTDGEGVDVVLNSIAGAAVPASLELLRSGGRFVEIGKRDIQENAPLGLRPFDNNLAYLSLDLDRLIANRGDLLRSMLRGILSAVERGELSSLPYRVFPVGRIADAFRHMAQSHHIGKLVLRMRDPHARVDVPGNSRTVQFSGDGTYVVTGGLGGFGLEAAKWLAERGVRNLLLLSRSGGESADARDAIVELEAAGARVMALAVDVSDAGRLAEALDAARRELGPLKGVFHAAMVLDDARLIDLTKERFESVLAPKAWGAWNLHELTRNDAIEHFVLFSSATTIVGNPGQANYVAACTFLDQLARHRRNLGLPAHSVGWGPISDVGYLARSETAREYVASLGFVPIAARRLLELLGRLLAGPASDAGLFAADWSRFDVDRFPVTATPRIAALAQGLGGKGAAGSSAGILASLAGLTSEERQERIRDYLRDVVAGVLGAASSQVETDRSITLLGLDSLMAVELQARVSRELGREIPSMRLLAGPSIDELSEELAAAMSSAKGREPATTVQPRPLSAGTPGIEPLSAGVAAPGVAASGSGSAAS